mgnify:CR=1 FL=1
MILFCSLLHTFAYDMEQSDNGVRIEQCKSGANTMASSKEYLNFILEQLSGLEEITYKPMMGELSFIIVAR